MKMKETNQGVEIAVKVIPNAQKNEIIGWENDRLKVRVNAVPEKGKANESVEALLAKRLGVPKSRVKVIRGHTSREKTVEIQNVTAELLDKLT